MGMKNTLDRYGSLSIAMHWLMLALLVAVYSAILLREEFPKGSELRDSFKMWHFMLGLSVFGLVFLRIAFRLFGSTPRIVPAPPRWQHLLSVGMHLALYLFLIAMPLLGWLTLSAAGKPIPFFGLELPAIWSQDKDFSHTLEDLHVTIGEIGYYLIGAHALAGLFHHYIVRDNTLLRILPSRSA